MNENEKWKLWGNSTVIALAVCVLVIVIVGVCIMLKEATNG